MAEPTPAAEPLVLSVENAEKEYGTKVVTRALGGVSLTLSRGEFVALIGPSGSGKSTLLNLIGLLERPTRGRVVLQGQDTTDLDDDALTAFRGKTLGFIFQMHLLLPAFTALENVMLPTWAREGYPNDENRARATKLLREVGLGDRINNRATDLSGGQQQRVAIARALAHEPALVLADEPTGNLDTASSKEAFALMRRFNRELKSTFLVVTHDPRIAHECDRIIEIIDGRIASDAKNTPA